MRGKRIFGEVISPLAGLSTTWTYRGLICLPNIDSRECLLQKGFSGPDIKVNTLHGDFILKQIRQDVITKKELEDESYSLMSEVSRSYDEEPRSKKEKVDNSDDYKKLISLLVGCQYVSFLPQTSELRFKCKSEKVKETTERVAGTSQTSAGPTEFPVEPVRLSDLPGKPAGDIRRKESNLNIEYFLSTF